jgi:hypothetical protein
MEERKRLDTKEQEQDGSNALPNKALWNDEMITYHLNKLQLFRGICPEAIL